MLHSNHILHTGHMFCVGTCWALLLQKLNKFLKIYSLGCGHQQQLLQGLCPIGHPSPTLPTRPGHPCASTILVATLMQE
jgi:hypothetical protein